MAEATYAKGNTFKEAVAYANARGVVLPDVYYGKLAGVQRNQAVSIAGLASIEQIKFVIDQVNKALKEGSTFKQFQDAVKAGSIDVALPKYRLQNIFQTNVQAAYSRGRWEQQTRNVRSRPYWMYDAINDDRVRPSHLALDNTILRWDDPWWKTHYTPNGYKCRCSIISLTEAQARKRGITEVPPEVPPDEGWDYNVGEDYSEPLDELVAEAPEPVRSKVRQGKDVNASLDAFLGLSDKAITDAIAKNAKVMPEGMAARTLQLITAYTHGRFVEVNQLLKLGDPVEKDLLLGALDAIRDNALATSRAKRSTLWRGSRVSEGGVQALKDDYKPGTVLSSDTFMTATKSQEQALSYAAPKTGEKPVLYRIAYQGDGGVDLGDMTPGGVDVMFFPAKEQFEVIRVDDAEDAVTIWLKPTAAAATTGFLH